MRKKEQTLVNLWKLRKDFFPYFVVLLIFGFTSISVSVSAEPPAKRHRVTCPHDRQVPPVLFSSTGDEFPSKDMILDDCECDSEDEDREKDFFPIYLDFRQLNPPQHLTLPTGIFIEGYATLETVIVRLYDQCNAMKITPEFREKIRSSFLVLDSNRPKDSRNSRQQSTNNASHTRVSKYSKILDIKQWFAADNSELLIQLKNPSLDWNISSLDHTIKLENLFKEIEGRTHNENAHFFYTPEIPYIILGPYPWHKKPFLPCTNEGAISWQCNHTNFRSGACSN